MPNSWNDTVEQHRQSVRDTVLDATAALVSEHGLSAVTMSEIAVRTGIGRATLYRYFPDVDAILLAWHERQVSNHLAQLASVRDRASGPERLEVVARTYALMTFERAGGDLAASLHRADHVGIARHHLRDFLAELIAEGASCGILRSDVAPTELASFTLHALSAAAALPSKAAVERLVAVTLTGLRCVQANPLPPAG